ncbi:hypothetical protein SSX86_033055 [Deinandra increscens subsp. villosa]|uniref:Uncharacterized protein n=1 Tax=Deinandra increscens subsp. villosa TaxID=3103831 RepID=A0AAP0GGQ9_9ASTR
MKNTRRTSSSSTKCMKHPKHQQSSGICSLCLRERLLKISKSSSRVITCDSSSSCSSSVSSVSSSSGALSNTASPVHDYMKGHHSFSKSKSMAFVSERIMEDDAKKKGGFWSKLMHSRTMREMLTTRV